MVVRFLYAHPRLERLVEGEPDCLIMNGQILEESLRKNTITRAELELAARKQGFDGLSEVETAHLEVGGALTFSRKPSAANDDRHREILARLDKLASVQTQLAQRLEAIQPRAAS
jgi:uncharacterized membrane protein YcaP (DUF421 family)